MVPFDPEVDVRASCSKIQTDVPDVVDGRLSAGLICRYADRGTHGMETNMSSTRESSSLQRAAALLADRWQGAWNEHDMHRAGELLAPDADFVNVGGRWLRGRGEFIDYHVRLHEMQMRNSTWSNLALTARALSEVLAVAHL